MRDDGGDAGRDEVDVTEEGAEGGGADAGASDDASAGRGGAGFDPTPYLRQLRGRGGGGQDYLDVKWRLLWLRREHPDAEILTEHVQIEPTAAIFKATVTLPTGGRATGYGSETAGDFGDFIEKAETKAIGRALNALGYGAQFGERGNEDEAAPGPRPVPAPPPRPTPTPPVTPHRASASASPPRRETPPRPAPATPPVTVADDGDDDDDAPTTPPIDLAAERDRATTNRPPRPAAEAAAPAPPPAAVPAPTGDAPNGGAEADPDLADYSWTAFWPWARGLGLNGPKAVEGLIGRPTAGLTPAQLRDLILTARNEG